MSAQRIRGSHASGRSSPVQTASATPTGWSTSLIGRCLTTGPASYGMTRASLSPDLIIFRISTWSCSTPTTRRGAHVAVLIGGQLLHLCAEVGHPAVWSWNDFARRPRYAAIIGAVRSQARRSPRSAGAHVRRRIPYCTPDEGSSCGARRGILSGTARYRHGMGSASTYLVLVPRQAESGR